MSGRRLICCTEAMAGGPGAGAVVLAGAGVHATVMQGQADLRFEI